jgi:hypothetical protein
MSFRHIMDLAVCNRNRQGHRIEHSLLNLMLPWSCENMPRNLKLFPSSLNVWVPRKIPFSQIHQLLVFFRSCMETGMVKALSLTITLLTTCAVSYLLIVNIPI